MITTTLRQIRQHSPCSSSWRTLLSALGKTGIDDEPLPLTTILRSNGLDDALWCLRTITGHDKEIIEFSLACLREIKHLMTDKRASSSWSDAARNLENPCLVAGRTAEAVWLTRPASNKAFITARARQAQIFERVFG